MTHDEPTGRIDARGLPVDPECPFCNKTDTELFSAFGSQLSVSTYWCKNCRSPFEFMKWGGASWTGTQPNSRGSDESA